MSLAARNNYLENEVLTATPQRLRKMLIDGAWRFCFQAADLLDQQRGDEAIAMIDRANAVFTELLSGIKPSFDVSKPVSELYVFLMRELLLARRERSATRLRGILEVLEVERETWRQLCEAVPHRIASSSSGQSREILSSEAEQILSDRRGSAPQNTSAQPPRRSSFSLDA